LERTGYINEVFISIQGEGIYAGRLQIFIRVSGCSLNCVYCDTPSARGRVKVCSLRDGDSVIEVNNPVDSNTLVPFIEKLLNSVSGVHAITLTGGEPLEQSDFLRTFIGKVRHLNLPIYLETNGLSESGAEKLAGFVDIVAMDIKLPSLCGGGRLFDIYRKTIPIFKPAELFFKIILAEKYLQEEFNEAVDLISTFAGDSTLVIQPAFSPDHSLMISGSSLLKCYEISSRKIKDVRVIPQIHKLLGLR